MSKIVRSSKYRHVFGSVAKKEECYDELKATRSAWDSNFVAANPKYFSVLWEAAGGGSFAVVPLSLKGKLPPSLPLISGHKQPVLDIDFHPFNDNLVASVSEDCYAKIWGIPEGGLKETLTEPLQTLSGHRRKIGTARFHPTANNVFLTSASDFAVKVWDIEKGKDILSVEAQHSDIINACEWNFNGSLVATACKDKKIRLVDPRHNSVSGEAEAHQGTKSARVIFLGNKEKMLSVGFTKTSEREYALWDPKKLSEPITRQSIDSASGTIMAFYDNDTGLVFLAGKGDGNIRYYEVVDDANSLYYLSEFKSATPQRGGCLMPKRVLNVSDCEVVRFLKLGTKLVEPISFQVPRKSDVFQEDLFPDCFSGEFSLTADQWLGGKDANPKTASLQGGFVQKEKSNDFKPEKQTEEKQMSEKEMRDSIQNLTNRISYLEAELVKKDARIKELESKN
jgi:WD40 repeat protein